MLLPVQPIRPARQPATLILRVAVNDRMDADQIPTRIPSRTNYAPPGFDYLGY